MLRSTLLIICLAVVAFGGVAWAQGDRPQAACVKQVAMAEVKGGGTPAGRAIAEYEGVYRMRFKNALVDGTKYVSEDILEIVRYGEDRVYIRTHLEFFNGHSCGLYGIASYEDGAFLFVKPKPMAGAAPCTLKIKLSKKNVVFVDVDHSCNRFCGLRGGFDGASFPYKARRTIHYMERLKNSRQYQEAVQEFEEKARAR